MITVKKKLFKFSLISVILLVSLWILKDLSLSWVEVNPAYAQVTINFLFPMDKDKFPECIKLTSQLPYAKDFDYSIDWLTDSVVCIKLKEQNFIKGQKAQLLIKDAPSKLSFISRNAKAAIQFKSEVSIIEPTENILIATEKPFVVKFNTPMNKHKLYKYLQCDTTFYIEPAITFNHLGKQVEDPTAFVFTPKTPLENNGRYILSFRKGMPSQSGVLLKQDAQVILTTDIKPVIASTYPATDSKWIGLYPRLKIETDSPTVAGYLTINNTKIQGKNIDPYHLEFLLDKVLEPNTVYQAVFQVESASGELSIPKEIQFTTTNIEDDKIWLEVLTHTKAKINVYKGTQKIKTFLCSVGDQKHSLSLGTYYITDKGESFVDHQNREGANFWIKVYDGCMLQGLIRDEYWNIKQDYLNRLGKPVDRRNIIINDEDIKWLYHHITKDTMIIIHR